jgi:hypothetical protein
MLAYPIGNIGAPLGDGKEYDAANRFKNSLGGYRHPVGRIAFVGRECQFPKQVANIETAGGVADQRQRVAGQELSAGNALGKIGAQSRGPRRDGGGGKVVEIVQHDMFTGLAAS